MIQQYAETLDREKLRRYLEDRTPALLDWRVLPFISFYEEALGLYREGKFYSCVCVCGITQERIEKELVNHTKAKIGPDKYGMRKQEFEDKGKKGTSNFLADQEVISTDVADAMKRLRTKRTEYVHPQGPLRPHEDAPSCVDDLATILQGTYSVFREYELREGCLVPKENP